MSGYQKALDALVEYLIHTDISGNEYEIFNQWMLVTNVFPEEGDVMKILDDIRVLKNVDKCLLMETRKKEDTNE